MFFSKISIAVVSVIISVASAATGKLGDAAITTGNPSTSYTAHLMHNGAMLDITIMGSSNGTGVMIMGSVSGLPDASLGPFPYHVHEFPITADGNCSSAGGHLDPYVRGENPPCDMTHPESCQVGDLSGKHGKVPAATGNSTFTFSYTDLYLSTSMTSNSSVMGRSVVLHLGNTTRIACANLTMGSTTTTGNGTTGNVTSPTVLPVPTESNSANKYTIGGLTLGLVGVVGAMLL